MRFTNTILLRSKKSIKVQPHAINSHVWACAGFYSSLTLQQLIAVLNNINQRGGSSETHYCSLWL